MPKDQKTPAVRITNQFHHNNKMVYELKCDGVNISISMTGATEPSEWHAEVTAKVLPDPVVAKGVGSSRGEALSGVREVWCGQQDGRPFPQLDWEAIREALATVKAI